MRFLPCFCAAPLMPMLAGPAAADAFAYSGTVGKAPAILELSSEPAKGTVGAGRYAYLAKGVDIPLKGVSGEGNVLRFEEEAPCTQALCGTSGENLAEQAPVGADWTLKPAPDGSLSGTWRDRATGKTLALAFAPRGTRPTDTTSYSALESLQPDFAPVEHGEAYVITAAALPYDFMKLDQPLRKGAPMRVGEGLVRLDTDPRADVAYPTVVSLAHADPGPLNAWLRQGRLQLEMDAFECLSGAYLGFGWQFYGGTGGTGYDGEPQVKVDHLSSRLMGLTESGSYFCGGAHPDHFETHRMADARTGAPIVPETLLRGWIARDENGAPIDPDRSSDDGGLSHGPSDELVAYVRGHRQGADPDTDGECGMDDLIASNLGVYFKQDRLVFTLKDLPSVVFACGADLLEVPLKDARPLLTEEGARYFKALDR